jgi:hypothetical protein
MTNKEMLEKIRFDRPSQIINEVISFKKNKRGFYDVKVDMEGMFFETKVLHLKQRLPYPKSEYEKLNDIEQRNWQWKHLNNQYSL